jgi:hypothetical protein
MEPRPLGSLVRTKLASGLLPTAEPDKLFAGYGTGRACSVCEEPLLAAQTEYEFTDPSGVTFRFHVGCYGLWEGERRRRGLAHAPRRNSDPPPEQTARA